MLNFNIFFSLTQIIAQQYFALEQNIVAQHQKIAYCNTRVPSSRRHEARGARDDWCIWCVRDRPTSYLV
jgi:hypothetical protein